MRRSKLQRGADERAHLEVTQPPSLAKDRDDEIVQLALPPLALLHVRWPHVRTMNGRASCRWGSPTGYSTKLRSVSRRTWRSSGCGSTCLPRSRRCASHSAGTATEVEDGDTFCESDGGGGDSVRAGGEGSTFSSCALREVSLRLELALHWRTDHKVARSSLNPPGLKLSVLSFSQSSCSVCGAEVAVSSSGSSPSLIVWVEVCIVCS